MAVFHQLVSSQYFDKRLHVYQVNVTISIQIRFTLKTTSAFQAEADVNEDGVVDLSDVGPFIEILTT